MRLMQTLEKILRWLAYKPFLLWLLAVACIWGGIGLDPDGHLGEIAAAVGLAVIFTAVAIRWKDRQGKKP